MIPAKRQTIRYRKRRYTAAVILLAALIAEGVSGDEQVISFGQGDSASLQQLFSAKIESDEHRSRIVLEENELRSDPETDLLLNFNHKPLKEKTGNYSVQEDNIRIKQRDPFREEGTAIFQEEPSGIILSPQSSKALFSAENVWKDFSFEFWLYPATLKDGETVFLWRGVRWRNKEHFYSQEIRCSFSSRKLVWTFSNFFLPPGHGDFTLEITPETPLIPRQWSHHLLRFNSTTGLIEYLVDGRPEGTAYANRENRENGSIFLPYTGKAGRDQITIGRSFTGLVDDFRLSSRKRDPQLTRYGDTPGRVITQPIDLKYSNSSFTVLSVEEETPEETDIFYFYRMTSRRDELLPLSQEGAPAEDPPPWRPISPGTAVTAHNRGRYLQIRADMYSNGNLSLSPHISGMKIQYVPDVPPPAPTKVRAENINGTVRVSWNPVNEDDIAGYKVYYGTKPGHYFGKMAAEGRSPIDTGTETSLEIHNLEQYRLYYFSVVAYDTGAGHQSPYSREASARPQRTEK